MRVIYLGISGVLHPSRSTYEAAYSRSFEEDGHRMFEAVPVLERILDGWPDVRLVLTSTRPAVKGLAQVLSELGPMLAPRVYGYTFEDLTTKFRRGRRPRPLSAEDYWRLPKSGVVQLHVDWLKPAAWVAIDDDEYRWTHEERQDHLVLVDGCEGLLDSTAQDRLLTVLHSNFSTQA